MHIIDPVAGKLTILPEPGKLFLRTRWFFATVLTPINIWFPPENAGTFSATRNIRSHKRPDVDPHSVVDIRFPADGLLFDRLPADENVERRFTFEDGNEAFLQF